jgi:hypothetical protein
MSNELAFIELREFLVGVLLGGGGGQRGEGARGGPKGLSRELQELESFFYPSALSKYSVRLREHE